MDRRSFVTALGASLGLQLQRRVDGGRWTVVGSRLQRIGLELYSVRDQMRLDPERTLAAVRAIGYDDVELLWSMGNFGRTPAQVKAALDREGLRASSCHLAPEALLTNWEKSLDDARLIGQEYLIVPSLPAATRTSLDEWRRWAERFNVAGAAARKAGLWLAFHNEPDHQKPIGGEIPYHIFLERTDPDLVRLQLDIGNMVMGGGDPLRYLGTYGERYWSFHVKDVVADRSHDTELGAGTVNLRAILAAVGDFAGKPVFVEQEGARDSLASARLNYEFLKKLEI